MDKSELLEALLCVNSNLRKASRVTTQFYSSQMSDSGVLNTQFTVLATIGIMEEASVTQLAETLIIDQTTVTRSINILAKNDWIEMSPSEEDKRVKLIRLTDTGKTVLETAFPLWQQSQEKVIDALGQEDTKQLIRLLNKVIQALS